MSFTLIIPPIPYPVTLDQIFSAINDANTTRYLSVVGLTVLLYDYALSFSDEVRLVWKAPRSFAKYAYLFNRYLVMACMLAVCHEMCGFAGQVYSTNGCRNFLIVVCMLSLCSIAIGNVLVLLRVVLLWDHRPIIFRLMTGGFIVSFSAQTTLMVLTLIELHAGLFWIPAPISMCATTGTTRKLIGVWAAPMLFEVLVLVSTILNALDRPHQARHAVARTLYRDGIVYFFAVSAFRALNLTLAIMGSATTTMLSVFFSWGLITTVLSRSLLNIREQELKSDAFSPTGRASPFYMRTDVVKNLDVLPDSPDWLQLKLRA